MLVYICKTNNNNMTQPTTTPAPVKMFNLKEAMAAAVERGKQVAAESKAWLANYKEEEESPAAPVVHHEPTDAEWDAYWASCAEEIYPEWKEPYYAQYAEEAGRDADIYEQQVAMYNDDLPF